MKKLLSILTLVTILTISLGTSSSFAASGYGDTMETAMELWNPYTTDTNEVRLPISSSEDDWYLVNNSNGSEHIGFTLILEPPAGVDLLFYIMKMDNDGNISYFNVINGSGPGVGEALSTGLDSGLKAYIRVMTVTSTEEGSPYKLTFRKY